jgi:homocitrate synthase NifV
MNNLKMNKELIDTTLRDGEQAPGVSFSLKEKKVIALSLMELGISEIEAGIPIMGKESRDFISWLVRENTSCRVSSWARLKKEDILEAGKTGSDIIHISVPVSDYHLETQMGSWKNVLFNLHKYIRMAQDLFPCVSVGFQDSFRSNSTRLAEVCSIAEEYHIYRIRFSDTVGNTFPGNVRDLITEYRSRFSGKIDFHGHNDLGLASANSLSALEAGADSVNVTINGVGERAGNASLEELAFILDLHHDLGSSILLNKIKPLSSLVSEYTRRPIAVDKPIIGDLVFTHESGIHCHGLLKNPLAYQPFRPEEKGLSDSSFVVGTHSGRSNLINVLTKAGLKDLDPGMPHMMECVRRKANLKKNFLSTEEVLEIYRQQAGRIHELV